MLYRVVATVIVTLKMANYLASPVPMIIISTKKRENAIVGIKLYNAALVKDLSLTRKARVLVYLALL